MTRPKRQAIDCPSCGHQQMEYVEANSTFCHVCGTRIALQDTKKKRVRRKPSRPQPATRRKLACFECDHPLSIPEASDSWQCPVCSTYIDLRSHRITTTMGRSIQTYGDIVISEKGSFGGSLLEGENIRIESGGVSGQMRARDRLIISGKCRVQAELQSAYLILEPSASAKNNRTWRCGEALIQGDLQVGSLVVNGPLRIPAGGSLKVASLQARSIFVEPGGKLQALEAESRPPAPPSAPVTENEGSLLPGNE